MTVYELLTSAQSKLGSISDSPLLDCQVLLAQALDKGREWLIAHGDDELDSEQHTSGC